MKKHSSSNEGNIFLVLKKDKQTIETVCEYLKRCNSKEEIRNYLEELGASETEIVDFENKFKKSLIIFNILVDSIKNGFKYCRSFSENDFFKKKLKRGIVVLSSKNDLILYSNFKHKNERYYELLTNTQN